MKKKLLITLAIIGGSLMLCAGIYFTANAIHQSRSNEPINPVNPVNPVNPMPFNPNNGAVYKPVIYLYPEKSVDVSVLIDRKCKLTCTYPAYRDGFFVTANPDGTLVDSNGKVYNYLYWEGIPDVEYDFSKGFCVKGEDTAEFLEVALEKLGLNRREANEFIVYWLPLMQDNAYNIITFAGSEYDEAAKLYIDPNPDTLIRVMMAWKAADEAVEIEPQELTAPERKGFTVVEWGGTKVD